jgi:hypothetical protein
MLKLGDEGFRKSANVVHSNTREVIVMSYQDKLSPWVVNKLLPNMKQLTVNRFRRRNDADAYLKMLKQMNPNAQFSVSFDIGNGEYASLGE